MRKTFFQHNQCKGDVDAVLTKVNISTPKQHQQNHEVTLLRVLTKINNKQKLQVKYNQPNSYDETNSTLKMFLENNGTPASDALASFVEQKMTPAVKKALAINIHANSCVILRVLFVS